MATKGEQTRGKILQAAKTVFVRQGFRATTITELLQATGTTKGNLYFHFAGKDSVGLEVLRQEKEGFARFLDEVLSDKNPGMALDNFFSAVFEKQLQSGFVGGCIFGNTALEASDTAPEFTRLVRQVFTNWQSRLENNIAAAQQLGQVRRDLCAKQLAELIVATIEGGIMQSRLQKEGGPLNRTLNSLRLLLELKITVHPQATF